ncbi:hypothetical protein HY641_03260 [Candidatus Woesearchaeota archaeon]|nr:hypothetical protein [Candidatus Woesearchaeota archaeon]
MADLPPLGLAPLASEKKPSGGIFGKKPKEVEIGPPAGIADLIGEVNTSSRRLRVLEDRYGNIRDKMQFLEQNQLSQGKSLTTEVRATQAELLEVKRSLRDIDGKITQLAQEVAASSKKEEVLVLKRYIELWQPLNFVTRNQVEKIVKEVVEERLAEKGASPPFK